MITAVDSSVILDVLTGDPGNASASLAALRKASREGRLVACESVIAEVRPAFESNALFEEFLGDWGLEFVPSTLRSSIRAGEMLRQMLARKKRQEAGCFPISLLAPTRLSTLTGCWPGIEAFCATTLPSWLSGTRRGSPPPPHGQLSPFGKRGLERSNELSFLGPVGDGKDYVLAKLC
jgi:hypothetical protein